MSTEIVLEGRGETIELAKDSPSSPMGFQRSRTPTPSIPMVGSSSSSNKQPITGLSRDEQKQFERRKVAEELLSTERTYASELSRFVEAIVPRMETCDTPEKQLFMEELRDLIHNLEQFLHLSRCTIEELQSSDTARIGPAVKRLVNVLPLYVQYARNFALGSKPIRNLMRDEDFLKDWRGESRERTSRQLDGPAIQKSNSARFRIPDRGDRNVIKRSFSAGSSGLLATEAAGSAEGQPLKVTPPPLPPPPSVRQTSLQGFLILPVQRVPRYVLLFQEILKRLDADQLTTDEDYQEKADLEAALEAARSCASAMNQAIETVKRLADLKHLQNRFTSDAASLESVFNHPEAKLIKSEVMERVARNGNRRSYLFHLIAPDTMLYSYEETSSPSSSVAQHYLDGEDGSETYPLKLKRILKLTPRQCSVKLKDEEGEKGCFLLETAERTMTIIAPSNVAKNEWVSEIGSLIRSISLNAPPPISRKGFFSRRSSTLGGGSSSPGGANSGSMEKSKVSSGSPITKSPSSSVHLVDPPSPLVMGPSYVGANGPPMNVHVFPSSAEESAMGMRDVRDDSSTLTVSTVPVCHICSTTFSLLLRKHWCGRCSRDVCASCSSQRRCLVQGVSPAVRVCDTCGEEMDSVPDSCSSRLVRLVVEVSGGFRKDDKALGGTDKLPREQFWGFSFSDQQRGPSAVGRFTCTIPQCSKPLSKATLFLLGKQGAAIVAMAEIHLMEVVRNPRCAKGFTERLDLMDIQQQQQQSNRLASVCVTFSLDFPPDLFVLVPTHQEGSVPPSSAPASSVQQHSRSAHSDGGGEGGDGSEKRRSHRRRLSLILPPTLSPFDNRAPASNTNTTTPSTTKQKFNLQLIKEYETLALENPSSILLARLVDILITWAIDSEPEGNDVQSSLANMLHRFHRKRATASVGPSSSSTQQRKEDENPEFTQMIQSETEYIKKLELLVEKHRSVGGVTAARLSRSISETGTSSLANNNRDASPTLAGLSAGSRSSAVVGKGSVLRLAATFGAVTGAGADGSSSSAAQTAASLAAVLSSPSVSSCLSVCEQMLTIHKSFLADWKTQGTTDSLMRLASLMKVYSSYGASLPEAYIALSSAASKASSPTNQPAMAARKGNVSPSSSNGPGPAEEDALSTSWFHLGASQSDPEDALRWVLMACGMLRPFTKPPSDVSQWSVLDLIISPLQRMNEYCQMAREFNLRAFAALNDTRRLVTKAIMRRGNMRLLKEIDVGIVDLPETLVDGRRWMLRTCPLVMVDLAGDLQVQRVVQAFLFSDQLILAKAIAHDRWTILKRYLFNSSSSSSQQQYSNHRVYIRDAAMTPSKQDETFAASMLLNPQTPAGDARFAFEIGLMSLVNAGEEVEKVTLMMPNLGALMSGAAGILSPSSAGLNSIGKQMVTFWTRLGLVAFDKDMLSAVGPGGFSSVDTLSSTNSNRPEEMNCATPTAAAGGGGSTLRGVHPDRSRDVRRKQQLRNEWFSDILRLVRLWQQQDYKLDVCWFDDIRTLAGVNDSGAGAAAAVNKTVVAVAANDGDQALPQTSSVSSATRSTKDMQTQSSPPNPHLPSSSSPSFKLASEGKEAMTGGKQSTVPSSPAAGPLIRNNSLNLLTGGLTPTSSAQKAMTTPTTSTSTVKPSVSFTPPTPPVKATPSPPTKISGSVTASLLKQQAPRRRTTATKPMAAATDSGSATVPPNGSSTTTPQTMLEAPPLPLVGKRSVSAPASSTMHPNTNSAAPTSMTT